MENQFTHIKNQMNDYKIVYIEDDHNVSSTINEFLKRYFKTSYIANNAEDGLNLYNVTHPDIMIVDIELPGMNGLELITKIRKTDKRTRIIITSAYTNKEFTLKAIELDITRYLDKPMTGNDILKATEKAINELKKMGPTYKTFDLGNGYTFDFTTKSVLYENETIQLRKKEIELLEFLIQNKNTVIKYETLQEDIWKNKPMTADAIRSQIKNIRQKTYSNIIKNVSGIGYTLSINDNA